MKWSSVLRVKYNELFAKNGTNILSVFNNLKTISFLFLTFYKIKPKEIRKKSF